MNDILNATEFGTKRANIHANPDNALRIEGEQTTVYQKTYTATVASGKKLLSVVVDGDTFTFTDTILVQNVRDVEEAIAALLFDGEVGVFVRAQYESGVLKIKYISSARRLGAITLETAGAMSTAETSTVQTHCRVDFTLINAEVITYDGNDLTLANTPYALTGNHATDDATRQDLEDDFKTAMTGESALYGGVKVTIDNANDVFVVSYRCNVADAAKLTVAGRSVRTRRVWPTFDAVNDGFYNFE